jgi:hypothetical protein
MVNPLLIEPTTDSIPTGFPILGLNGDGQLFFTKGKIYPPNGRMKISMVSTDFTG